MKSITKTTAKKGSTSKSAAKASPAKKAAGKTVSNRDASHEHDVIIALPEAHKDDRGALQQLIGFPIGSVHIVTSKKGSVRANHYHKKDDHYCYLATGKMNYYFRPAGSQDKPKKIVIRAGQLFYTPPLVEHAMQFTEDSVFYVFAKLRRKQIEYEKDIVRIPLVKA